MFCVCFLSHSFSCVPSIPCLQLWTTRLSNPVCSPRSHFSISVLVLIVAFALVFSLVSSNFSSPLFFPQSSPILPFHLSVFSSHPFWITLAPPVFPRLLARFFAGASFYLLFLSLFFPFFFFAGSSSLLIVQFSPLLYISILVSPVWPFILSYRLWFFDFSLPFRLILLLAFFFFLVFLFFLLCSFSSSSSSPVRFSFLFHSHVLSIFLAFFWARIKLSLFSSFPLFFFSSIYFLFFLTFFCFFSSFSFLILFFFSSFFLLRFFLFRFLLHF